MTLTIVMLAVLSGDDAGEEHDDCSDDDVELNGRWQGDGSVVTGSC